MVPCKHSCGFRHRISTTIKGYNEKKEKEKRFLWQNGLSKKFGRLADGFPGKLRKGTNLIRFVAHNNIPVGRTVPYSCIVVDLQPKK